MVILHVIVDLLRGGAELMLKRLIAADQGRPGIRHAVISLRSLGSIGPELQAMGVEVRALGLEGPVQAATALPRLVAQIRTIDPDIVQNWMYHADFFGGLAARAAGKKHVLWNVRIAEIGPDLGVSRLTSLIRRGCAAVSGWVPERIVYVAHSARAVHERLGYDADKSIVIPNGYDIPAEPRRGMLREELSVAPGTILIGSAARFNAQKDHRSFVAAAEAIATRRSDVQFVLTGRDVSWQNEALAGWIEATGHRSRFHLLGLREDLLHCLSDLDVFCLHSIGEGFPNVVAEAMSVSVPCVTTDVGDAAYLVGDTGTVVPPSEAGRLAEALLEMIDIGPEERRRIGARARARIEENFSMEVIRGRYEALYRSILDDQ